MNKSLFFGLMILLAHAAQADQDPLRLWHAGQHAEAVSAWQRQALAGDGSSATFLGHIHRNGLGMPVDASAAYRWYRLAAGKGFPEAQYELALMYEMGIGTESDIGEATYWYGVAGIEVCPSELNTEVLLQQAD